MKTVALVGFASATLGFAHDSQADEFWSVNNAIDYNIPRIDRLFEIHPLEYLELKSKGENNGQNKHWDWLLKEHPFPIYMQEVFPQFPSSVQYPFEDVYALMGGIKRGERKEPKPYLTSSIGYMLPMAILEGFERIEIYGVEMASGTEYGYQKANTEFWIGMAAGQGIEIYIPEISALLNAKLYHVDGQMIGRQTLESHLEQYTEQRNKFLGIRNHFEGRLVEMEKEGIEGPEKEEVALKFNDAHTSVVIATGAIRATENLIKEIDLDDPEITLENDLKTVSAA